VTQQYAADRTALIQFVRALEDAAQLIETPTEPRFGNLAVAGVDTRWAPELGQALQIRTPTSLVVEDGRFLWFDHDGTVVRLLAAEVRACMAFAALDRGGLETATACCRTATRSDFDDLVGRLLAPALSAAPRPLEEQSATFACPTRLATSTRAGGSTLSRNTTGSRRHCAATSFLSSLNADENVAPPHSVCSSPMPGVRGGRPAHRYDFIPNLPTKRPCSLGHRSRSSFSNYVWTLERNLASRRSRSS
jgi:hypothetical protein